MNTKNKSMSTAVLALFLTSMFVFAAVPIGLSYGDDPVPDPEPDVTIHVGQEYEYTPIFNIKNVDVEAESDKPLTVSITKDGSNDGIVTIKGLLVGTATVTVTGTSQHISSNTSEQTFTVEVIAALTITSTELTFYQFKAGSEGYVTSSNDPDVVFSAQGLPAGLYMDADSDGLIYGKATVLTESANNVTITATNLKTGMTINQEITVKVVVNGSDFTLTKGDDVDVVAGDDRYFVLNSVDEFDFDITTYAIGGAWTVKASAAFADAVNYSVDAVNKKLVFTSEDDDFSGLSGDYAVYIYHTVNGVTAVEYIVIHFQTDLEFDTEPVASFKVNYGSGLELVEVNV